LISVEADVLHTDVATSVGAVIRPAGPQKAIDILSTPYREDPADPSWTAILACMQGFKQFTAKYLPGADITDPGYIAYGTSYTM
jgi:branched-chain amino acid transport system substrate-binding protein